MSRDTAQRLLAVAVRALPESRSEWGLAMIAELAQLDGVPVRRRFALGCVRAAVVQRPLLRATVHLLALAAGTIVAVALAAGIGYPGVRTEMVVMVLLLAALSWAGRRSGTFGPVRRSRPARLVRAGGYLAIGAALLIGLVNQRDYPTNEQGATISTVLTVVLVTTLAATLLALTANGSVAGAAALRSGGGLSLFGALAWYLPAMREATLPADVGGAVLLATLSGAAAALLATGATRSGRQAAIAGLLATAGCALLMMVLATGTMLLAHGRVPDIVGPVMVAGSTPAQKLHEDLIELGDAYGGLSVLAGILGAGLGLLVAPTPRRPDRRRIPAMISALLVTTALAASSWPLSIYLGTAGLLVATGTLITSRAAALDVDHPA